MSFCLFRSLCAGLTSNHSRNLHIPREKKHEGHFIVSIDVPVLSSFCSANSQCDRNPVDGEEGISGCVGHSFGNRG